MAGSWSPCRTEAKARKALQGTQQSAESVEMEVREEKAQRRDVPSCLVQQRHKSYTGRRHMLLVAAFIFRDLCMRRLHDLVGHCKLAAKGITIYLKLQGRKCFKK